MFQRHTLPALAIAICAVIGGTPADATASDLQAPLVDDPICGPVTDPNQSGGESTYPTNCIPLPGNSYLVGLPDLTLDVGSQPGISIAGVHIPWNGSATIAEHKATSRFRGRCGFPFSHLNMNAGSAFSIATTNAIYLWSAGYPLVASSPLPSLPPNIGAVSSGTVWLQPGTWILLVKSDAASKNAEYIENNNVRAIRITVTGSCF